MPRWPSGRLGVSRPSAARLVHLPGMETKQRTEDAIWLIAALPWQSGPDLAAAVHFGRASEFYDWYLKSDFQNELEPTVEELGFGISPYKFEIVEVEWDGEFVPLEGAVTDDDGLTLVEYELGQSVEFRADF